jgi:signal peptide peptidase SppA
VRRRYDRQGVLAIDPRAFFDFFFDAPDRGNESAGDDVAVVVIRGPLDQHDGWWCDSYDAITERIDLACKSAAKTIVLRIDSPGGTASGCFETARTIHDKCEAAGKKLVAYVEGSGFSAAYALACAADRVVMGQSSLIGSVGVIASRFDWTGADERYGLKVSVITSGERKADGHPSTTATPAELAELQHIVDELAGVFFDFVAERRGLDRKAVEALEAGIFTGRDALKVGLADEVSSFETMLASLASGGETMPGATKLDDARAALEEAAKGDDDEAKKAKKALAAMDESDDKKDDDDDESAEGDEPSDDEGDDEKDTDAKSAKSAPTLVQLAALVNKQGKRINSLSKTNDAQKRDALLASRPDLDAGLVKVLRTKPLAEVQPIVDAIEKPKAPKAKDAASATTPAATRGSNQGGGTTAPSAESPHAAAMDVVMGFAPPGPAVRRDGTAMIFSAAGTPPAPKKGGAQ